MADCTDNPRIEQPNDDLRLHPNCSPGSSLTEQLGKVADDLRQLYTDLGLRPYRLFSVVEGWSGGEEGRGTLTTLSEREFLPTPNLNLKPLRIRLPEGGYSDNGFHTITEISPRLTEDQIRGLLHGAPLPPGQYGYLETRIDSRDGQTERRRFVVRGVPWRDAENFQWVVKCSPQQPSRHRNGTPDQPRAR